MITSLRLKNFKSFKDQYFEFGNLNLLTGLNGMGKSSVIHALLLLREAKFDRILFTEGLNLKENKLFNAGKREDIKYEFAEKPCTIDIELGIDNEKNIFVYDGEKSKKKFFLDLVEKKITNEQYIENESLFNEDHFVYLQAERISPEDFYPMGQGQKNKFGNQGEYSIYFYHQQYNSFVVNPSLRLNKKTKLQAQVEAWLHYISPAIKIRTTPASDYIHLDYSFHNSTKHHDPRNVGFGITYCLPILIALLTAEAGDLLIIENPESHLHPQGQSKLAELMCLVAQNGVQILCETHSDHIVNGIRVAIAENKALNIHEKVKIFYFSKAETDFSTQVFTIPINNKAELQTKELRKNGVTGFFDQFDRDLSTIFGL